MDTSFFFFSFSLLGAKRNEKNQFFFFQKSLLEDKCNLQTLQYIKRLSKMSDVFKTYEEAKETDKCKKGEW